MLVVRIDAKRGYGLRVCGSELPDRAWRTDVHGEDRPRRPASVVHVSHDTHVIDGRNKALELHTRDEYLQMTDGWTDPFGPAVVYRHDRFNVVRDDLMEFGSKARFGSLFIERTTADTLVYVAPRTGYAAVSLAELCRRAGKKLVLFAPACKEASHHQLKAIEAGADVRWVRIAAMPNLNKIAKAWADERKGYEFVPFGLNHPLVTAAIVRTCDEIASRYGEPSQVWSVCSTGVLTRGLQIGWQNADFRAVAVARNMHEAELGRAQVYSHPLEFQRETKDLPPFPSVATYDAKAWTYMKENGADGALFWNVAGPMPSSSLDPKTVDSQRDWHDDRDLRR